MSKAKVGIINVTGYAGVERYLLVPSRFLGCVHISAASCVASSEAPCVSDFLALCHQLRGRSLESSSSEGLPEKQNSHIYESFR